MIHCFLASLAENTPANTKRVKEMAEAYMANSRDTSITADQIHEIYQGYTCRNISTPQFWLVTDDTQPVGFMVTQVVTQDGVEGIEITQGYLDAKYAVIPRLSRLCMEQVEKLAKASNFKFVMCCTSLDADVYERWIKKAGYKRQYTVFSKEI